jgi:hypothetical protein
MPSFSTLTDYDKDLLYHNLRLAGYSGPRCNYIMNEDKHNHLRRGNFEKEWVNKDGVSEADKWGSGMGPGERLDRYCYYRC